MDAIMTKINVVVVLCLLLLFVSSCQGNNNVEPGQVQAPIEKDNYLELEVEKTETGATCMVSVIYHKKQGNDGPRVMDLYLKTSSNVELVAYEAGEALNVARKNLMVRAGDENQLRLVALSQGNINRIQSGSVAKLQLRRTDSRGATVNIEISKPIFAPAEANHGLQLGDPIRF